MYTKEGLQNGILNIKKNIDNLEQAILRERKTMSEYKQMIRDIDEAEALKEEAQSHVTVVREDGSTH